MPTLTRQPPLAATAYSDGTYNVVTLNDLIGAMPERFWLNLQAPSKSTAVRNIRNITRTAAGWRFSADNVIGYPVRGLVTPSHTIIEWDLQRWIATERSDP
jgi:hypothetical protein